MIPVKDVMTTNVVTFREDTPVEEIALTLTSKRITGGPVMSADGQVVGIVSETDVFSKKGKFARDIMSQHVITVSPVISPPQSTTEMIGNSGTSGTRNPRGRSNAGSGDRSVRSA